MLLLFCRDTPDVQYVLKSIYVKFATAIVLACLSTQSHALDDQWYVGIGGGGSLLSPNPEEAAIDRNSDDDVVGSLIIGRDFDARSSGQFQLYSLGEIDFNNGESISYSAAEAALLYRFYDSRDNQRGNPTFGVAVYGRFGIGAIDRDTSVELSNETSVYFGAGAGIETYFTTNLGVRLEAQYLDTDASAGTISLIGRFGGQRRGQTRRPPPINTVSPFSENVPETAAELPETAELPPRTFLRPGVEQLPETAILPETAQLPETAILPETAQLPETAILPEIAQLPETAVLPEIAQLPETAQLPQTEQLPQVTLLPETEQLPQVALLNESEQPNVAATRQIPETTTTPNAVIPGNAAVPDVEIMTNAIELTAPDQVGALNAVEDEAPLTAPVQASDVDGDGIANELDSCAVSPRGFPVGNDGCSLFGGEIDSLRFESDSVTLATGSTDGLDYLANLLVQFPQARIELVAHTDTTGTEIEQTRRTRGRLRSIGLYMVSQGVRSRQLILRSFGSERAKFDNNTEQGRIANNRVEVVEKPR